MSEIADTQHTHSLSYNTKREGQANTKKQTSTRYRWAFIEVAPSLTKYYDEIENELMKAKFKYYLAGWHRGETKEDGTPYGDHIHIFIQWINPKEQGKAFLNKIYNAHVAPHKDYNPTGIINYIKCQDKKHITQNIKFELIKEDGESSGTGKFPSIEEVYNMPREERQTLGYQYRNIIKEADERELRAEWFKNMIHNKKSQIKVDWFFGPGGTGKTQFCKSIALNEYEYEEEEIGLLSFDNSGNANLTNLIMDDTYNIKCLIFNEYRDSKLPIATFLEYILNENCYRKLYGYYYFPNLERILISSAQNPYYIYNKCSENRKQISRRLTNIYYMEGDYDFEEQKPEFINGWTGEEYFKYYHDEQINIASQIDVKLR